MNPTHKDAYVSAATMGEEWPLTVPDGVVRAYRNGRITFVRGGREYGVNGTARGANSGCEAIETIERQGHNCTPLLDVGLKLQEQMHRAGD
jgi:hypothetical protein